MKRVFCFRRIPLIIRLLKQSAKKNTFPKIEEVGLSWQFMILNLGKKFVMCHIVVLLGQWDTGSNDGLNI